MQNMVSWIKRKKVSGARIYALNSDAQHLSITEADERLLMNADETLNYFASNIFVIERSSEWKYEL